MLCHHSIASAVLRIQRRAAFSEALEQPWTLTCKCDFSPGTCLDILCTVDAEWQNLMCDLQTVRPPAARPEDGVVAVSLQRQP